MSEKQEIMIYESNGGVIELSVDFRNDTIWATQAQIAELFDVERSVVTKHLNNIIKSGELEESSICAFFAHMGNDGKQRYETKYYSLDAILSVGYRTNSKQAIKFRQWSNKVLKEYLLNGTAINQKRLEQLNKTLEIISRSAIPEVSGLADILQDFANGLDLLDKYDHQCLEKPKIAGEVDWQLTYSEARTFIDSMRFGNESSLFGHEKDESFKSSLGTIYQTFGGQELYPSVQEKAANLLYLVVKNHSFSDGNKRIAAALFVYFLEKSNVLKDKNGKSLIDNNALAAMTLMLALSKPQEKEIMCNLVMNFLEG
jgi:prophage maintenance system killer protein